MSLIKDIGNVHHVNKRDILNHEKYLLKELVLVHKSPQLIQAPISEEPVGIAVPDYVGSRQLNESSTAYKMVKGDSLGENKIKQTGHLMFNKKYLFNVFTLKDYENNGILFVLVHDLMKVLRVDNVTEEDFLNKHSQLYPLVPNQLQLDFISHSDSKLIKESGKASTSLKFVTAKSAYVQFGAAIICEGVRLVDDYWETIARESNLTSHHRVFKISGKIQKLFNTLQPSFLAGQEKNSSSSKNTSASNKDYNTDNLESPSLIVMEQPSTEIKSKYQEHFCKGEITPVSIPGQNINGSLEISSQYKIPKYHNRFSFIQSAQNNVMDVPIGHDINAEEAAADTEQPHSTSQSRPTTPVTNPVESTTNKPVSRMLSSLLDSSPSVAPKSRKKLHEFTHKFKESRIIDPDLIINGWKFDSLPIYSDDPNERQKQQYSFKGIPHFDKKKLIDRLQDLTPNQIKELEHVHDAVAVSTGIQTARRIRKPKWLKYWQYKAGVPIGLRENQCDYFENVYLKETLKQVTVVTEYDETSNTDKIHTTVRIPNANFLTNENIQGFQPPYTPFSNNIERKK